jgi:hypothetical protein
LIGQSEWTRDQSRTPIVLGHFAHQGKLLDSYFLVKEPPKVLQQSAKRSCLLALRACNMDGKGQRVVNVFVKCLWRSVKYKEAYLHA